MIREIKTTLAIDGEREFKAALADAGREMRVMNADLKAMSAEFKATDDAQRYYTQRSETLNSKVKQQEEIVEALTKAVKDSTDVYGTATRQTDEYRIRLSNATAKLFDMRREAEQANRDLEELGRDSGKIGRQIERGIGDAAEDTADKLDGMFAKVAQDVNALKTSVGFQVATEVGGFIVNAVQGVTGFVEENQELNRQLAITEHNISKYDFDWMTTLGLVSRATAITGNQEGALEAINNLVSTQVTNEELINAALEGILGVFITTGGALSLESLAEDVRASVVNKEATGTYAEVLEELIQGIVIEDVNKALAATKSAEDALEIVTSYLTEAGFQTTTKSFEEQNKAYIDATTKRSDLALKWAALAEELTPIVSDAVDGTITVVDGLTEMAKRLKAFVTGTQYEPGTGGTLSAEEFFAELNKNVGQQDFYDLGKKLDGEIDRFRTLGVNWETINEVLEEEINFMRATLSDQAAQQLNAEWLYEYFNTKEWKKTPNPSGEQNKGFWEWLFPSAGAETLPTADLQEYGSAAWQEMSKGMLTASEGDGAVNAAMRTAIAEMSTNDLIEDVKTAGKNLMIEFGNGIATGAEIPISNVRTMVDTINAELARIATPAFGLGWSGMTGGNIYLYNQQKSLANTMSKTIGAGVRSTMHKK